MHSDKQVSDRFQNAENKSSANFQIAIARNFETVRRKLLIEIDGPANIDSGAAAHDIERVNQTWAGCVVGELCVGSFVCDGAGACTGFCDAQGFIVRGKPYSVWLERLDSTT